MSQQTENTKPLERLTEQLLLRSMGAFGYLKIPFAFSKRFKYDKTTVRDPDAVLTETNEEARLTFVWKKDQNGNLADKE